MFRVFLLKNIERISPFYSGYRICKRKSDIESPGEEECIPLLPTTNLNKTQMETNKEGTRMHYIS